MCDSRQMNKFNKKSYLHSYTTCTCIRLHEKLILIKLLSNIDIDSKDAASILANGMKHLKKIEAVLEIESKKSTAEVVHLVNGKFSAPDFHLFEMLDQFEAFCKTYELGDLYSELKRLQQFKEGFAKLE